MPVDRPLYADSQGRLIIDSQGRLGCCCGGDFEGDATFPVDPSFDVVVDNPFSLTIEWVEWSLEFDPGSTGGRVYTGWGPQGEGITYINFDEGDDPDGAVYLTPGAAAFRYHCNQPVPALGYIQFGFPDPAPPCGFHYKIHYSRP